MFVYHNCYISIELTFLKELMLIKQEHQNSMIFVTIGISYYYSLKFQPNVYNRCNDLLMMSMNLSNIANLNIKDSDYRCIIVINFILLVIYCLIFSVLYVTVNRH